MKGFLDRVREYIDRQDLLPEGCPVVAGVSGGADSLAMLLVLASLRKQLDLVIEIVHLNHGLRGEAADRDEAFVRAWGERLNIPCHVRQINVAALAASSRRGLELTARLVRHECLNEAAGLLDDSLAGSGRPPVRIALAHHLNDQAETLLMNLGRGSGLDGLSGIKPCNGRLIRPLLTQPRSAIEDWLTEQHIDWRQDQSNNDLFTIRNRLRNQVLPLWRQVLGYDPAPLLARTAENLEEDRIFLDSLTRAAAAECLTDGSLRAAIFLNHPPALQNRLLRLFWHTGTGSGKDLAAIHVRMLRDWLPAALDGQQLCLPDRWHAILDGELLILRQGFVDNGRKTLDQLIEHPVRLKMPGLTVIKQLGWQIAADLIENIEDIVYNDEMEYFHLNRVMGCVIRHRQPGDRIHPRGRAGGKSLKKFLNEQQLPRPERGRLPVLACGREIVWIPGVAAGSSFVWRPGDGREGSLIALKISKLDSGRNVTQVAASPQAWR